MKTKKFIVISVLLILIIGIFTLPTTAAKNKDDTGSAWNIYLRPAIRWGTNSRTLYIVDLLIPLYQDDKNIVFTNTKFTPNDHDGWEFNAGLGYRRMLMDDKLVVGLNTFFDRRKADSGNFFNQWGIGAEIMADIPLKKIELGLTGRFNFYSPISTAKMGYSEEDGGHLFQDIGIYPLVAAGGALSIEEPLRGFDYEVGVRIPYVSKYVETWAYAGGYNYFGKYTKHVDGFMARLEVIPTDFVRLNFEYKNDNVNKDEFYGEVAVEVPFSIGNLVTGKNPFEGIGKRFSGSRELKERMTEPVRRDVDIVIVDKTIGTAGGGGTGGLVDEVIFVSEGGETDPAADGTFEHPWPSVDAAISGDPRLGVTAFTIHIINDNGGDGVAGGGDFTAAGALANLLLWGSGTNHPAYPYISNMTSGFPEMSTTLTVDDANAEVMGIYFNNAGGYGLIVQGGSGMLIHNNQFNANGGYGMWLNGFNTTSIYNNAFAGGSTYALLIGAGDTANIYSNTFTGIAGIRGNGGAPNVTIDANTFNVMVSAVNLEYGGNNIENLNITNNAITANISGSDAIGIRLTTDSGGAGIGSAVNPINIDNNTITLNSDLGAAGILLDSDGNILADITNNNMTGGITGGIDACGIYIESRGSIGYDSGMTTNPILIENNPMTVTGTTGEAYGIHLATSIGSGGNHIFADITGNDMTGGITGDTIACGIALESINFIGIYFDPVTITNNPMNVSSAGFACGITLESEERDIFADIIGNDMTGGITSVGGSEIWGIFLNSTLGYIGSETDPVNINNNRMILTTGAGGSISSGIYLFAEDDVFSTITGNNISNTIGGVAGEAAGIFLRSDSEDVGSAVTPVIINNNTITVNGDLALGIGFLADNIFANVTGNIMTGGITGNTAAYGISLDTSATGNIGYDGTTINPVTITNNPMTVTSTIGEAIGIYLDTNNNLFTDITGNDMTGGITGGSSAYGIHLFSQGNIGYDGTTINPVNIDSNPMTVTASLSDAYGIFLNASGDIFADITDNNMTGGITGDGETWGIYLGSSNGNIGSNGTLNDPVLINNNPMTVTSNSSAAYGINLYSNGNIFADITNNNMSGGITGNGNAYGIDLTTGGGHVGRAGATIDPVYILNNTMTVTSTLLSAYGVHIDAGDIFADISNNTSMNITANSGDAFGAYLVSTGVIGNGITPALFQNNSGTITALTNRYMLWLEDAVSGSSVDWTGSSFTPVGGGWSGNYPVGTLWIQDNLTGGTITP